jgi:hypothetical protein
MHWLGLIVVIFIASAVAMVLWQRLTDTQQKLASLHDELRRNDLKLQNQLSRLETKKAEQENIALTQPLPEGEELSSPPSGRG